jgi:3-oxo-5-alpha-steroid 4-dehydrogenase 1
MLLDTFHIFLYGMITTAVIVFVSLYFVEAGYGIFQSKKWGISINNKLGWFLMEFPVFVAMFLFLTLCDNQLTITRIVIFGLFQVHYLQRSFIFPLLIKGKSKIPLSIMSMGIVFNLLNAIMQGYWLFFESYKFEVELYNADWLTSIPFIAGTTLFIAGFAINLHSDYIVRHLRKSPTDTNHYLPTGGMFNYVTSANYFGEIIEWLGFAILTFSLSGLVFLIWTCANLVPRAYSIHNKYKATFAEDMNKKRLKAVFPFLY